jgi:hypothetical protein
VCVCKTMRQWTISFGTVRGLGQKDTDLFMHCLNWKCYMGLQFGICLVYESGVPLKVVWTSSEVLKSNSDLTVSLSADMELEICLIGP